MEHVEVLRRIAAVVSAAGRGDDRVSRGDLLDVAGGIRFVADELERQAGTIDHETALPAAEILLAGLQKVAGDLAAEIGGLAREKAADARMAADHEGFARMCRWGLEEGNDPRKALQRILDLCELPEAVLDEHGLKRGVWAPGLIREVIAEMEQWIIDPHTDPSDDCNSMRKWATELREAIDGCEAA